MKRLLLGILMVSALAVAGYSKDMTAIGLYGNVSGMGGLGGAVGISMKFGRFPVLGLEYNFNDNGGLAVSCDWWVVNEHLTGVLDYYIGLGGFFNWNFNNSMNFGGRIPFGLQIFVVKNFELFGELAPIIYFLPSPNVSYNARLGFRVHF